MGNVFVSLPVPAGNGAGAWVDTSGMAAGKTLGVDGGPFSGTLFVESSNDGQTSAGPVDCPTFAGATAAPVEIVAATQWMRIRRAGGVAPFGSPTVTVGAPAASGNVFAGMSVPPGNGAGVGTDLSAGGDVNTFNIVGPFSGQVFIDISTDAGATWSPAFLVGAPGQTTNGSAVGMNVLSVIGQARVRRVGVLAGPPAPIVSVGSSSLAGAGAVAAGRSVVGLFAGLSGTAEGASTVFFDNVHDGGSATNLRYPTRARTITRISIAAPAGTPSTGPTATLIRYPGGTGAPVVTALAVALAAGAPAGTNATATGAVVFADGDAFDFRVTQPITPEGAGPYVGSLEEGT